MTPTPSPPPSGPLGGVLETVLYCTSENEAATRRFYDEVLHLRKVGPFAYRLGPQLLLLFNSDESRVQDRPPPHGASGPIHTCFLVAPDGYDEWKEHLRRNGVEPTDETTWERDIRSFYFEDPAGNLLEIAEGDMWPR